jgi:hypothetical protein
VIPSSSITCQQHQTQSLILRAAGSTLQGQLVLRLSMTSTASALQWMDWSGHCSDTRGRCCCHTRGGLPNSLIQYGRHDALSHCGSFPVLLFLLASVLLIARDILLPLSASLMITVVAFSRTVCLRSSLFSPRHAFIVLFHVFIVCITPCAPLCTRLYLLVFVPFVLFALVGHSK